jgi:flavin reductase (DIM6/NTAB) family NADH-FMN oxidoreductase RutF
MQHFSIAEISEWDRFYRSNFINSLSGFKSVSLIGTTNVKGQPNLAIFSNIVHLGADPALVGFINRPLDAAPHTLSNIQAVGEYTINHISESFVEAAHQTSAKYTSGQDEFTETGLTAAYKGKCKAPFVAESKIQYGLQLIEVIPIKYNNTFLVIGTVKDVYLQKEIVQPDGFISIDKAGSITSLGIDAYYSATSLTRYEYAKPGKTPKKIIV